MQKFPYFVKFRSLEGIDDFYEEMQNEGYELKKLWPSSTYTEYWLTKDEVNKVTSKPFVESCKLPPELDSTVNVATPNYGNPGREIRYVRSVYGSQADPLARDWKWPACWGDKYQERLGYFGQGAPYDLSIKIHGNGENVDILISDFAVCFDSPELSDDNGVNRVVTHDWEWEYNNNNGIANTRPKYVRHPLYYSQNDAGFHSHGVQSATTIAGRYHGFANKANVYTGFPGMGVIQMSIYYNDFHKNKPKNPNTGWPNQSIIANQVGSQGRWNKLQATPLQDWVPGGIATNVTSIAWTDGQIYSASNPNPTGWTDKGVDIDFGVNSSRWGSATLNEAGGLVLTPYESIRAGIPVTASAGNTNEWIEGRVLINNPQIQFTAANGNGVQNMATFGIGINAGIDAHEPVVTYDGTHRRPGRVLGQYTTGFRSWQTGALVEADTKAGFSSWGDVAMFAPGLFLIAGCNFDHGFVAEAPHLPPTGTPQGWATNRHGDVSYNTQYGGTSGSNPVAVGLIACLMSGKKPGPRFTMGDFWRTADRSINNQNLKVDHLPDGIDKFFSYFLDMSATATTTYTVTDVSYFNPPTYSFGTNIQDRVYGDQTLAIYAGGLHWNIDRYAIVGVGANNSSYQFIDFNTTVTTGPYAPFAMVENPTFNMTTGQQLFIMAYPIPLDFLETHHPIQVRSNPDDPNTEVSWYNSDRVGLYVYPPLGTSGTFWYVCTHHGAQMRGQIVITAASFHETYVLKHANTTGTTDIVQNVKYFKKDLNNFHFGSLIETEPGDPNFEGLKYPGESIEFTIPAYDFLTIGDKYYLQSQQDLSKFISLEVMERFGNLGSTRTWAGGVPFGTAKTCHFEYERPKEKVQDMQVGQRPYVNQVKAGSNYQYNIGWGPTYPRMNRRYYNAR